MSLYLCIDPGLSHTGLAISDSTHLAQPLTTIRTTTPKQALDQILSVIKEHKPSQVIIGQPAFGPIHTLAQEIFAGLKQKFKGKVYLFPEDLSSKEATIKLIQSGSPQYARRRKKHAAAAAVILQNFLDSQSI